MSKSFSMLLAAAAMAATSAPIAAQDDETLTGSADRQLGTSAGEWEGSWQDGNTWRGIWNGTYTTVDGDILHGQYIGTFTGEGRFEAEDGRILLLSDGGWEELEGGEPRIRQDYLTGGRPGSRFAYTDAEREAWLADCRILMSHAGGYSDYGRYRDRDDSGLVGGLLGAAVGGFAGNRIADGDRLAGTLIGAGLGGLAGAVIGSSVDRDGVADHEIDPNSLYAARYCDAYLRRYEMQAAAAYSPRMEYRQTLTTRGTPHYHSHHHGSED